MMKTMKLALLVCLILLACVLMFTACDSGNENQTPSGTTDGTNDGTTEPETKAHVHSFGEWETTKNATCTLDGNKERYCSCGEKQTGSIAATGHNYGEWEITKAATCTEGGEQTRMCVCGDIQMQNISALGHRYSEWETVKDVTCEEDGIKERYCQCGEKEIDTIIASHSWREATCLEAKMCTKCGLTNGTALGHTTATGICSRCNEEIMPPITLPNMPISTSVKLTHSKTTMKITNITYEFHGDTIKFYYAGEKTYDNVSGSDGKYFCAFSYKLYDAEGYVVASGIVSVKDISVGDKFRNEYFSVYNVAPSSSYRLVIEDYV